jgi:transglutaminase-like putative cysteine protease
MKKLLVAALSVITATPLLGTLVNVPLVSADAKFDVSADATYTIEQSGTTDVSQEIDIKNLTATSYPTEYTLSTGSSHIKNVSASYLAGGAIQADIVSDPTNSKIHLVLNQHVTGQGAISRFKLDYRSDDFTTRNGLVWEVTVPKLGSADSFNSYNLTLKIPKEIGAVSASSPTPATSDQDGDFTLYHFTKDQLVSTGVNASFGDHQVFNFTLNYHLANNSFLPVFQTIPLPPDTEIQTVVYTKLDPTPTEVTVDTDGNYLAKYRLDGNKKVDVVLTGQVKIWNKPTNPAVRNWTNFDLTKFTASDKYWETTYPAIADKAKELKTPLAVYNYVTSTLKYDYNRAASGSLERFGAAAAVGNPTQAVCMEFTDLFVALSRAAGIPAREVDGYAYTTNSHLKPLTFTSAGSSNKSEILHAWAEYWNKDEKRWVQVDPTWGSTTGGVDYFNKLDMNHFAFVIKGLSSTDPVPAGSYKTDPKNQTHDVDVSLAPTEIDTTTDPKLSLGLSPIITAIVPFTGTMTVENRGNSTVFNPQVTYQSGPLGIPNASLDPLPPLSTRNLDLAGRVSDLNLNSDQKVVATLIGTDAKTQPVRIQTSEVVSVRPAYTIVLPAITVLILAFFAIYIPWRFRFTLVTKLRKLRRKILKA